MKGICNGTSIANFSDLSTWPTTSEDELQSFIQDALDEIEFIVGDPNATEWGQLRARYEHQEHITVISRLVPKTSSSQSRREEMFFSGSFLNTASSSGRLLYLTFEGAIAEAASLTGTERISEVVFAIAYVPSFQHINNYQWTPGTVTYDASCLVRSTSYYVQQMFSINRGTHVLQTWPPSSQESVPLLWVRSTMVNSGNTSLVTNIALDFTITGFISVTTLLTPPLTPIFGHFNISNTLEDPDLVVLVGSTFSISDFD
ncbi:putative alpha-N-arabinofuranosidase A [Leucoagaricus sp. SymC.cos]|nr:putative alpha-N-arabinofuranosidase A [Leucoagaricus sp. SymC.cos]